MVDPLISPIDMFAFLAAAGLCVWASLWPYIGGPRL